MLEPLLYAGILSPRSLFTGRAIQWILFIDVTVLRLEVLEVGLS